MKIYGVNRSKSKAKDHEYRRCKSSLPPCSTKPKSMDIHGSQNGLFRRYGKASREAVKNFDKGTELPFVVIDKVSNTIIGSTRLYDISYDRKTVELGSTFYDQSVRKTSVNTECKYLLLKYAFEA